MNYNAQKGLLDLRDATDILVQKIRKTENLMMAYSEMPDCFIGPNPCNPLSGTPQECVPSSYGIYFPKDTSYFDIFADKNGDLERHLVIEQECNCYDDSQQNECIERTFLPESIKISKTEVDTGFGYSLYDYATVNIFGEDLSVQINNTSINPNEALSLRITLCIISECADEKKEIIVNNRGMVDVQN